MKCTTALAAAGMALAGVLGGLPAATTAAPVAHATPECYPPLVGEQPGPFQVAPTVDQYQRYCTGDYGTFYVPGGSPAGATRGGG